MVADTVADSAPLSLMQLVIHPSGTGDTGFIHFTPPRALLEGDTPSGKSVGQYTTLIAMLSILFNQLLVSITLSLKLIFIKLISLLN